MENNFEPLNSNLIGEDMSNFALKGMFKRRKKNKKSRASNAPASTVIKPVSNTPVVTTPNASAPVLGITEADFLAANTYNLFANWDMELYGLKDPSRQKGLKQNEAVIVKVLENKNNHIVAVFLEKGQDKKDKSIIMDVPAWYHNFENDKYGKTVESVLRNYFK